MGFSKSISLPGGSIVVSESAGQVSIAIEEVQSVGGGQAAGVVAIKGSASLVLSGKQAFDLGMAFLEAHSPAALVPVEAGVQALGDAVIGQV